MSLLFTFSDTIARWARRITCNIARCRRQRTTRERLRVWWVRRGIRRLNFLRAGSNSRARRDRGHWFRIRRVSSVNGKEVWCVGYTCELLEVVVTLSRNTELTCWDAFPIRHVERAPCWEIMWRDRVNACTRQIEEPVISLNIISPSYPRGAYITMYNIYYVTV